MALKIYFFVILYHQHIGADDVSLGNAVFYDLFHGFLVICHFGSFFLFL